MAVGTAPGAAIAAENILAVVPIEVPPHVEIRQAIVVVIEESRARAPAARGHARFRGHVGERAISVVVVQHVVRKTRDVNVRIAVVVVIADGNPHVLKARSEEHTSELQSPCNLVCRLLLEKKKKKINK